MQCVGKIWEKSGACWEMVWIGLSSRVLARQGACCKYGWEKAGQGVARCVELWGGVARRGMLWLGRRTPKMMGEKRGMVRYGPVRRARAGAGGPRSVRFGRVPVWYDEAPVRRASLRDMITWRLQPLILYCA